MHTNTHNIRQLCIRFFPFLFGLILIILLFLSLRIDPQTIPSARINQPIPSFSLPAIKGLHDAYGVEMGGVSARDLQKGDMSVVNFWASWCEPCRIEMPLLLSLRKKGYKIYGINVKDTPSQAIAFLESTGNPFLAVGSDPKGLTSIDFGVYGLPETFVIDGKGIVVYRHVGVLTAQTILEKIVPLLDKTSLK